MNFCCKHVKFNVAVATPACDCISMQENLEIEFILT